MRHFDLKEHLEHPDREVVTREGRPVQIVYTELNDSDYPVVAIIGNWCPYKFTADGLFQAGKVTKYDLFFANERREGWVNLFENPNPYESHNLFAGHSLYETEAEAEKIGNLSDGYVATVKIEWENKQ